jgi:hypothetical protein
MAREKFKTLTLRDTEERENTRRMLMNELLGL